MCPNGCDTLLAHSTSVVMGIRGLLPFLRKKVPEAFTKDYAAIRAFMAGKSVAIDACNHAVRLAMRHETSDSKRVARAMCDWIQDLQTDLGVNEVGVIFDGKHNVSKATWEAKRRQKTREQAARSLAKKEAAVIELEAKDPGEIFDEMGEEDDTGLSGDTVVVVRDPVTKRTMSTMTYQEAVKERAVNKAKIARDKHATRDAIRLGPRALGDIALNIQATMHDREKHVFAAFAEADGETACAQLCTRGDAEVIISNDSDCVVFPGSEYVLMFLQRPHGMQLVDVDRVLAGLGMDSTQFLVMCVLAGCDFAPHIHQMGPAGAYKLAKKYGDYEGWIRHHATEADPHPEWAAIVAALPAKCEPPPDWSGTREEFLALCVEEFPKAAELFSPDHEHLVLEEVALDRRFALDLAEPGSASGYGSDDLDQ